MKLEYEILHCSTKDELVKVVNEKIAEGWHPKGAAQVLVMEEKDCFTCFTPFGSNALQTKVPQL